MIQYLTFDIETIPQPDSELSDVQKEEITRKVDAAIARDPNEDPIAVKNKLMATSPYFGKIICIGLHLTNDFNPQGDTDTLVGDEKAILTAFWNIVRNKNLVYISYNGLSFDVPFIMKRSMKHGIVPTEWNFTKTKRFSAAPHYDVKEIISDWDRFAAPSLKLACDLFGIPSPKEGEVKAEGVYDAYLAGEIQKIAEYCERDVIATYELYKKLKGFTTW